MPELPASTISVFGKSYSLVRDKHAHAIPVKTDRQKLSINTGEIVAGFSVDESGDILNIFSDGEKAGVVNELGETLNIGSLELLPAEIGNVFAFMGEPVLQIETQGVRNGFLSAFIQDVQEICRREGMNTGKPIGFTAALMQVEAEGSVVKADGNRILMDAAEAESIYMSGLMFTEPEHIDRENMMLRRMSEQLVKFPFGGGVSAICIGMFADSEGNNTVRFIEPETRFMQAEMKIYRLFED